MFLPTTFDEVRALGWDALDVILVTGDSYIDSPFIGVAVIGKVLVSAGYRVGVIAQPDISGPADITRLGAPRLFWGVTAGSVDSMASNYTALRKKRKSDDYTPGGLNTRRPDRATMLFGALNRAAGKPQFLTCYMIAAHPGCTEQDMARLKRFVRQPLYVEKDLRRKLRQKEIVTTKGSVDFS